MKVHNRALPEGRQWIGVDRKGSHAAERHLRQRSRGHVDAEAVQQAAIDAVRQRPGLIAARARNKAAQRPR